MLLAAEAAKNAQRADLQNHLETAQNALQDKQQVCFVTKMCKSIAICVSCCSSKCIHVLTTQELSKMQTQLEEQGRRLQEKQEQCSQLEASVKDSRDKLLTAEQRIETLETQTKVSLNHSSGFLLDHLGSTCLHFEIGAFSACLRECV